MSLSDHLLNNIKIQILSDCLLNNIVNCRQVGTYLDTKCLEFGKVLDLSCWDGISNHL